MSAMLRGRHTWVLRALSGNPLVRRHDRIEALVILLGLLILILAVPAVVHLSGGHYAGSLDRIEKQTHALRKVDATVSSVRTAAAPDRFSQVSRTVQASWKSGFEDRTETVKAPAKAVVGDHIDIWLDARGAVSPPPQTVADARGYATAFGIGLWLGTAAVCVVALMLTRIALDRRRFTVWDHEWKLLDAGGGWANHGRAD